MAAKDDYLIDLLVDMGQLSEEQLAPVREEAAASGEGLVDLLLAKKIIRPIDVAQAKATHFGYEFINLGDLRLTDDVIAAVPRHVAKRYRAVPVAKHDHTVAIALADPSDLDVIDCLQRMVNADVELRVAMDEDIDTALNKYYGAADDSVSKMIQDITEGEVEVGAAEQRGRGGRRGGGRCRRADHQAGQHFDCRGVQGAGLGHSPGAAGQDVPRPLPD